MDDQAAADPNGLVRNLIIRAFPDHPDLTPMSHDECVEMRHKIVALVDDHVPNTLKQVLIDLLETHTGELGNSEWGDSVIQFLDVDGIRAEESFDKEDARKFLDASPIGPRPFVKKVLDYFLKHQMKDIFPDYDPENEYQDRLRLFSTFTQDQACAIYKWLDLAENWEDMLFAKDAISSAMNYWGGRCRACDDKTH